MFLSVAGCNVKVEYLPQISFPYVAEMEFLKEVKNVNGKAKKKKFKDDLIYVPFYFLLKIKEIENNGIIIVRFYETKTDKNNKIKTVEKKEIPGQCVTEKSFYENYQSSASPLSMRCEVHGFVEDAHM